MYEYVSHCFDVRDTIVGAIRKYNPCDIDEQLRIVLLEEFKRVNGLTTVPRPGMSLLIPVCKRQ